MKSKLNFLAALTAALLLQAAAVLAHADPEFADGRSLETTDALYDGTPVGASDPISLGTVRIELRILLGNNVAIPFAECSGSLITPDVVLTAGHCLAPIKKAGSSATIAVIFQTAGGSTTTIMMKDYAIYPEYNVAMTTAQDNDLSLIRLQTSIKDRQPLPLASAGDFQDGSSLTVAGYGENGKNDDLDERLANDPVEKSLLDQAKNVDKNSPDAAKQALAIMSKAAKRSQDFLRDNSPLLKTTMTGALATDASIGRYLSIESQANAICEGDSGGPSFASVNNRLAIVGVHSGGNDNGCAASSSFLFWSTHYMGADVFVPNYSTWIKTQVHKWESTVKI